MRRVYLPSGGHALTEQQVASNAALYADMSTAFTRDEQPPQVGFMRTGDEIFILFSVGILYSDTDSFIVLIFMYGTELFNIALYPDGNTVKIDLSV